MSVPDIVSPKGGLSGNVGRVQLGELLVDLKPEGKLRVLGGGVAVTNAERVELLRREVVRRVRLAERSGHWSAHEVQNVVLCERLNPRPQAPKAVQILEGRCVWGVAQ
jgi:hypothetical protein